MALFPERRKRHRGTHPASIGSIDSDASALDRAVAADVLLRHLFVPPAQPIDGIEYAAVYRFAEKHSGGDVIDVYKCSNDAISFSLTDISGKGVGAALHAGLVKYGVRAYSSEGHAPRSVLRSLNRFYLENDTFEGKESFASVFYAAFARNKHVLTYASAGHEGLILSDPRGGVRVLPPTGPLIGVFHDQHELYDQKTLRAGPGSILLAVSDGVSDARTHERLYGIEPLIDVLESNRTRTMEDLCCAVVRSAVSFAHERVLDDMAVLAVRFL
jgi:phosphoserine phosphatase RsbU/P